MPTRNKDLSKEIGKRIALQRKKRGMTQEQAAECAGLSQQFLACLERGTKGLGQDSIIKLSRALDVSTDYLLKGTMRYLYMPRIPRLTTSLPFWTKN